MYTAYIILVLRFYVRRLQVTDCNILQLWVAVSEPYSKPRFKDISGEFSAKRQLAVTLRGYSIFYLLFGGHLG